MTVKFENANKKKLDFSFIKLKEQFQLHFMKNVQHKKTKILVTETLTKTKVWVLKERISLNQHIMIKKNLRNDMMIRSFLNQYEVIEKISDLCNMTVNISSDLHIKQETDLSFLDWSVLTENFYINLSRKIEKKSLNSTEFIYENFWKTDLSRSADTADV